MQECEEKIENEKVENIKMDSYGTNVPQNDTLFCHTEERSDVSIHKTGTQPQNSEMCQPSMDSYGTDVPQNDEVGGLTQNDGVGEITSTRHTEEFSPSCHTEEFSPFCHTEERSDVSIHKTGTQLQNSEKYQPSLDSYGTDVPQNDEVGGLTQNDRVGEWAQNDKTGYIPNTPHTEELSPSCHTEEFSPFCHTEERSDVSIHNNKCHIFALCAILFFAIVPLLFSAPAQAQGLQFVYIFNDVQVAQQTPKPPVVKCELTNEICKEKDPQNPNVIYDDKGCHCGCEIRETCDKNEAEESINKCPRYLYETCPDKNHICKLGVCICDYEQGYIADPTDETKCVCDESKGLSYDAETDSCVCQKGYEFDTEADKCVCQLTEGDDYVNYETCSCESDADGNPTHLTQMSNGEFKCVPQCANPYDGLIVLLDRSSSTTFNNGFIKAINNFIQGLDFPLDGNFALYLHDLANQHVRAPLPYGSHTIDELKPWFYTTVDNEASNTTGVSSTGFSLAVQEIKSKYCKESSRLVMAVFIDDEGYNYSQMQQDFKEMREICDLRLLYIYAGTYMPANLMDADHYKVYRYTRVDGSDIDIGEIQGVLNNWVRQQGCVAKSEDVVEWDKDDPSYWCNTTSDGAYPRTSWSSQEQCMQCEDVFWTTWPYYPANFGICFTCDLTQTNYYATQDECNRCVNRFKTGANATDAGTCVLCSNTGNYITTQEQCHRCSNTDTPRFWDTSKNCWLCSYTATRPTTKEECQKCPNRFWRPDTNGTTGTCTLCANGMNATADGLGCACGDNEYTDNTGKCIACNYASYSYSSENQCAKCANQSWWNTHSSYAVGTGICLPCDLTQTNYYATQDECNRCVNRFKTGANATDIGPCILCSNTGNYITTQEECNRCSDTDSPRFLDTSNYCWSCSYTSTRTTTKEECQKCPNRFWRPDANGTTGTCTLCANGLNATADGLACECANDSYTGQDGICYACNNTSYQKTTAEQCHSCDNSTQRFMDTSNYCRLCTDTSSRATTAEECHSCTDNKRFMDTSNNCLACDYTSYKTTSQAECNRCSDTDSPRFLDTSNYCWSCSYTSTRTTTKEECQKCPNRFWRPDANGTTGTCTLCANGLNATADGLGCACGDNEYTDNNGYCRSCDNTSIYPSTPEQCYRCPADKTMWAEYVGYKYCFSCQYAAATYPWFTKEECDRCPNRVWNAGYCLLK